MASHIAEYVQGRIQAGANKAQIREELLAVGWSDEDADSAYRDALIALSIPTPAESGRNISAKKPSTANIVLNFFSFILLAIIATALGTLYFQIINKTFPDPITSIASSYNLATTRAIHHSIASLVIVFPLYIIAMVLWFRSFRQNEGRVESKLTKWLTYLVLLVASATIVGDLIAVVFMLLQGELTIRFLLKTLSILIIATMIFVFYFIERREIQYRKAPGGLSMRFMAGVVTGLVLLGVIGGFFTAGSPQTARMKTFDRQRARDLGQLARCIERYANEFGELPTTLGILGNTGRYTSCTYWMHDPQTKRQYAYRIITASKKQGLTKVGEFELCANFSLANKNTERKPGYGLSIPSTWNTHNAGRSCKSIIARLGKVKSR